MKKTLLHSVCAIGVCAGMQLAAAEYRVSAGMDLEEVNQKVRPGDILGAVAGETGIPGKLIGSIDMYDKYTFVEVPREFAKDVLRAMKNAKIKGKNINIEPATRK